jgi:hypothetical protein
MGTWAERRDVHLHDCSTATTGPGLDDLLRDWNNAISVMNLRYVDIHMHPSQREPDFIRSCEWKKWVNRLKKRSPILRLASGPSAISLRDLLLKAAAAELCGLDINVEERVLTIKDRFNSLKRLHLSTSDARTPMTDRTRLDRIYKFSPNLEWLTLSSTIIPNLYSRSLSWEHEKKEFINQLHRFKNLTRLYFRFDIAAIRSFPLGAGLPTQN